MKKYTIDVNEFSHQTNIRKEESPKTKPFSWSILFLAILATFILFPESVDTVNDYYKQQKEHYQLEQKRNESREITTK